MKQKLISMTEKEISRHNVIKNLIDGKINGKDASKQIGLKEAIRLETSCRSSMEKAIYSFQEKGRTSYLS